MRVHLFFSFLFLLTLWSCSQTDNQSPQPSTSASIENLESAADATMPAAVGVSGEAPPPPPPSSTSTPTAASAGARKEKTTPQTMSSGAAVNTNTDTNRKFVRTADVKCRVDDVVEATQDIEKLAISYGGFISTSNLTSAINRTHSTAISADSSLETTYYTRRSQINVRVPNQQLDTMLRSLAQFVAFFDHRNISGVDVQFQLLEQRLAQKRNTQHKQTAENTLNHTRDDGYILDQMKVSAEQADNAYVETQKLNDKIAYSTVDLEIYQNEAVSNQTVTRQKSATDYQSSFWTRFVESLGAGWYFIEELIIALFAAWPFFILLAFGGWWYFKRSKRNKP
jgi:Domain of unknown function (DUF4349)